ncbi:MAG TPA: hypothetical protein VLZ05_24680 [Mycobacterium sp.]|nr:hypothetical protein [Mycobacterium sp.]HUH71790.1 hypothetical protein [Mycobacterium sp.]
MSKKALDEQLADRLARIGDEAEAGEADQTVRPIPAHVKVTRGNPRNKVLQVRLNPDEYAAIERIAQHRGLPASTVAREALLTLIDNSGAQDDRSTFTGLAALAERIKAIADERIKAMADHPVEIRIDPTPIIFRPGHGGMR